MNYGGEKKIHVQSLLDQLDYITKIDRRIKEIAVLVANKIPREFTSVGVFLRIQDILEWDHNSQSITCRYKLKKKRSVRFPVYFLLKETEELFQILSQSKANCHHY